MYLWHGLYKIFILSLSAFFFFNVRITSLFFSVLVRNDDVFWRALRSTAFNRLTKMCWEAPSLKNKIIKKSFCTGSDMTNLFLKFQWLVGRYFFLTTIKIHCCLKYIKLEKYIYVCHLHMKLEVIFLKVIDWKE